MLTYLSGNIEIENITIQNSYFMMGFIYYMLTDYDLYSIIFGNSIQNSSYLKNINGLQESVYIRNSLFFNYNILLNYNPEIMDSFISLFFWRGSITIENSFFDQVFNLPSILKFSNENIQGNIIISNSEALKIYL